MAFQIRRSQQEQVEREQFSEHMLGHLKQFSPLHAEVLGEEGLRRMIQMGVENSTKYKFTQSGTWQLYVELMFVLGSEFDSDPQYPWAASILVDAENDQITRANSLHKQVMEYLTVATGKDRVFAKQALLRARQLPYSGPSLLGTTFDAEILKQLHDIYPQRSDYLGEPALRELIARGKSEATNYSVSSDAGVTLVIALMFVLGHGVCRDPKYAFVHGTLSNESIPDPNLRAERLFSKTMTYLDHALNSRK